MEISTVNIFGFFLINNFWAFLPYFCIHFVSVVNPKIGCHRWFEIETLGFKIYSYDSVTEWVTEKFKVSQLAGLQKPVFFCLKTSGLDTLEANSMCCPSVPAVYWAPSLANSRPTEPVHCLLNCLDPYWQYTVFSFPPSEIGEGWM